MLNKVLSLELDVISYKLFGCAARFVFRFSVALPFILMLIFNPIDKRSTNTDASCATATV
jgi:hypothetical protein